jgi:hypothetical protein
MVNRTHLRILLGALLVTLLWSPTSRAQSISPVILEYREKAKGQFQVTNDTEYPLDVVLEPFSFNVGAEGKPAYRPLDPGIQVKLSTTSFRLGPKQAYTVFYDARAEQLPAWFTIYATVMKTGGRTDFRVAYQLPHTVYLLPKKNLERESLFFQRAEVAKAGGRIEVEFENQSENFGRVEQVEVQFGSEKKTYAGFPLFPHQRRILLLESDSQGKPQRVTLRFARFKVEQPIRVPGASQ